MFELTPKEKEMVGLMLGPMNEATIETMEVKVSMRNRLIEVTYKGELSLEFSGAKSVAINPATVAGEIMVGISDPELETMFPFSWVRFRKVE